MEPGKTFVHGKRKPFEAGVVKEYECLHAGPDLSPGALAAFHSLSVGFTWRSGSGQGVLAPVAAVMVLQAPPRLLVCRVVDDGSDNLGRPHLVRVEGVELPMENSVKEKAAMLADPTAWSVGEPTFGVEARPSPGPPSPGAGDFSAMVPGQWVFLGEPGNFWFKHGPAASWEPLALPNIRQVGVGIDPGTPAGDPRVLVPSGKKTGRVPTRTGLFRTALIWLLLVSSLVTGGLGLLYQQRLAESQAALEKRGAELGNKVDELEEEKRKVARLNKKNTDQIGQIDRLRADNARLADFERQNLELSRRNQFLMNNSNFPDEFRKAMKELDKQRASLADQIKNHNKALEEFQKGVADQFQKTFGKLKDPGDPGVGDKATSKPAGPKDGWGGAIGDFFRPAGRPGAVPPSNDQ